MRYLAALSILIILCNDNAYAQETFLDTFIRKDGIYSPVPFESRQPKTLFYLTGTKRKQDPDQLLSVAGADRIKLYLSNNFGKTEPYTYFRVLRSLQLGDSATYFDELAELPSAYRPFFTGLYKLESNQFHAAASLFTSVTAMNVADSLLAKENQFWSEISNHLHADEGEYNAVAAAYYQLQSPAKDRLPLLLSGLDNVKMKTYLFDKFLILYNYHFRVTDYSGAAKFYDSLLAYTSHAKMKASLAKNRDFALEMLEAKSKFISITQKKLYHYELEYLFDHLAAWANESVTDKDLVEDAGFALNTKYTKGSDSIYTRWLKDTSIGEAKTKFEVLSFIRTPIDKGGRRFVIVKLGFSHEETYKKYLADLKQFRSKPIQQSVYFAAGLRLFGDEYLLNQNFIAAMYQQNDPIIKYELALYQIEDKEGNIYGVDTLF